MSAQVIHLPRWGAYPDEWGTFDLLLGLTEDMLPVVSNPAATISPNSSMKQLGKTPSCFNGQRQVVGIAAWTSHVSTSAEVDRWSRDADLGICLQTRTVRALDVDVGDVDEAAAIGACINANLPKRIRANASKFLCLFRLPGDMSKRVIKTAHGMIEFLASGQQAVICGTHTSGVRYEWVGGLPNEIPELSLDQFETLWKALAHKFAIEEPTEAKISTKAQQLASAPLKDATSKYLLDHGHVKSFGKDGSLNITCPFEAEHTTEGAESATTYFPAHTGGYERGHFHCLHAHCSHRTDQDFRDAVGVPNDDLADFDVVEDSEVVEGEAKPLRYEFKQAALFSQGKPAGWIVKGVLPEAVLAVMFGASGSGKSFLALDIVCAVARGVEWRGRRVKQSDVAYVCAEGARGFQNRLIAYAGKEHIKLADIPVHVLGDAPNFLERADVVDLVKGIKALPNKVGVIVVDTFSQVMPGADENSGSDVGKALGHCKALHKATGALILLVHHSGKDSSKGARGWSGLRAAADAEIEVNRVDDARSATITKMKDGEDGDEFGFTLSLVPLGADEDLDPITSCVVDHCEATPKAKRKIRMGKRQKQILAALDELLPEGDEGKVAIEELADWIIDNDNGSEDLRKDNLIRSIHEMHGKGISVEGKWVTRLNS